MCFRCFGFVWFEIIGWYVLFMGSEVVVERVGGRVEVVLSRVECCNAVIWWMVVELWVVFVVLLVDEIVGVVFLRGVGGVFCLGFDLDAVGLNFEHVFGEVWVVVYVELYCCWLFVVVALERYVINVGASLVLAVDLSVAGESSFV